MFLKVRKLQKTKIWKIYLNMFIPTENDTESHRNTQNLNIAQNSPKTLKYIIFQSLQQCQNHSFQESKFKQKRLMLIALFILLRATQPN